MDCVEGFRNSKSVTVAQVVMVVLAATAVATALIAMIGRFHGAHQISHALGPVGKISMLTAGSVVGAAVILTIVLRCCVKKQSLKNSNNSSSRSGRDVSITTDDVERDMAAKMVSSTHDSSGRSTPVGALHESVRFPSDQGAPHLVMVRPSTQVPSSPAPPTEKELAFDEEIRRKVQEHNQSHPPQLLVSDFCQSLAHKHPFDVRQILGAEYYICLARVIKSSPTPIAEEAVMRELAIVKEAVYSRLRGQNDVGSAFIHLLMPNEERFGKKSNRSIANAAQSRIDIYDVSQKRQAFFSEIDDCAEENKKVGELARMLAGSHILSQNCAIGTRYYLDLAQLVIDEKITRNQADQEVMTISYIHSISGQIDLMPAFINSVEGLPLGDRFKPDENRTPDQIAEDWLAVQHKLAQPKKEGSRPAVSSADDDDHEWREYHQSLSVTIKSDASTPVSPEIPLPRAPSPTTEELAFDEEMRAKVEAYNQSSPPRTLQFDCCQSLAHKHPLAVRQIAGAQFYIRLANLIKSDSEGIQEAVVTRELEIVQEICVALKGENDLASAVICHSMPNPVRLEIKYKISSFDMARQLINMYRMWKTRKDFLSQITDLAEENREAIGLANTFALTHSFEQNVATGGEYYLSLALLVIDNKINRDQANREIIIHEEMRRIAGNTDFIPDWIKRVRGLPLDERFKPNANRTVKQLAQEWLVSTKT